MFPFRRPRRHRKLEIRPMRWVRIIFWQTKRNMILSSRRSITQKKNSLHAAPLESAMKRYTFVNLFNGISSQSILSVSIERKPWSDLSGFITLTERGCGKRKAYPWESPLCGTRNGRLTESRWMIKANNVHINWEISGKNISNKKWGKTSVVINFLYLPYFCTSWST